MTEHPPLDRLRSLLAGELGEGQKEALVEHLTGCENCFQTVEALWRDEEPLAAIDARPDLDDDTAERLERRLLSRIHLASFGNSLAWLTTEGFLRVVLGLLRPFLAPSSAAARAASRGKRR